MLLEPNSDVYPAKSDESQRVAFVAFQLVRSESNSAWNQARPNMAKPCTKLRKQQVPVTPMRQNYEDRTSGDDTDTRASTPSISSSNLTPSKILFFVLLKFERKITTEIRA